jgi:hypothetical protein
MEQTILDLAGTGAQALVAALFLVAGLWKAADLGRLERTLEQLGLDRAQARPVAVAAVGAELVAAAGLLASPAASWPRALVVALAAGFALAGLRALAVEQPIGCSCFGSLSQGRLGWRQVALLPGWLLLVALAQARPPAWDSTQGLAGLAALLMALAAWQAARGVPRYQALRVARRTAGQPAGLTFRTAESGREHAQ